MGLDNLIQSKLTAMGSSLGCCTVVEHVIEIDPVGELFKCYPVSHFKQKIIKEEVDSRLLLRFSSCT